MQKLSHETGRLLPQHILAHSDCSPVIWPTFLRCLPEVAEFPQNFTLLSYLIGHIGMLTQRLVMR